MEGGEGVRFLPPAARAAVAAAAAAAAAIATHIRQSPQSPPILGSRRLGFDVEHNSTPRPVISQVASGLIRIFMGTEAVPVEAARAEAAGATLNTS